MNYIDQWQVRGSAAELYERYLVPAITALWAKDIVERAAPRPQEAVLDLACGTGIVARLAAARMGAGRIVGLDINAAMLAVARSVPSDAARRIEWHEGSALAVPFPDGSFDLILCQLGLQFFPDRPLALREMHRVLAPRGRLALSVYTTIEHTPATNALADALDRHLGAGASQTKRSEHLLSNELELRQLVSGAGFRSIVIKTVTQRIRFPSATDYVQLQLSATPLSALLEAMEGVRRQQTLAALTHDVLVSLRIGSAAEELVYPQEAYVLLADR